MTTPKSHDKSIPDPGYQPPPSCGTETTPPCPSAVFLATRTELIFQLAGDHRHSREELRRIGAHVDEYLIEVLRSTERLAGTTFKKL